MTHDSSDVLSVLGSFGLLFPFAFAVDFHPSTYIARPGPQKPKEDYLQSFLDSAPEMYGKNAAALYSKLKNQHRLASRFAYQSKSETLICYSISCLSVSYVS